MEEKILNLEYKLVGTLNKLDVIPELVYPVFENEGQYFLQSPSNPLKIETFDFLFNEEMIKSIHPLRTEELIMPTKKFVYTEGDDFLYAYQKSEKEIFIGTFHEFQRYVNCIEIEDEFMSREIPFVIGEVKRFKLGRRNK